MKMRDEFQQGDVIVCIGSDVRWVVWDVGPRLYELRRLTAFLNDAIDDEDHPDDWGNLSKLVGKQDYVKVGKWDFDSEREVDDEEG